MSFQMNYEDLLEIDVTPLETESTWARIAAGITGADPSNNEDVAQDKYLDGDGYGSSDVTGAQKTLSFSGHRVLGDTAQDYIASLQHELGGNRKTSFRYTDGQGRKYSGPCTIANVEIGGGGAESKKEMSFEVHLNGKPDDTAPQPAPDLSATVAAGTSSGTTTFDVTPDGDNTLGYRLSPSSLGTQYEDAYVSQLASTDYTAGDEIEATEGQFLCMYELDEYKRCVKYDEHELETIDIAT